MAAFLNLLEKVLTWFFSLAFAAILIYGYMRWSHHREVEADPWYQAQKKNTLEAYQTFLRQCLSCPQEEAARTALAALQREDGLMSQLARDHLPELGAISLPAFSLDGKRILATGGRGPDFWDAETGHRDSFGDKTFAKEGGHLRVDALDYAPNSRRIGTGLSGVEGGRLMMWDLTTEAMVGSHVVDGYDVKAVLFSSDSNWLGWRGDGPVGVWNVQSGKFFRGNHEGVQSIAFLDAGGGELFFLTSGGRDLWVWEASTLTLIRESRIDSDRPLLGLSHDGHIVVYTDGRVLEAYETATATQVATLRDLEGDILSFCRDSDTGYLAIGTRSGFLYLWDPKGSPLPIGRIAAHAGPIEVLACGGQHRAVSVGWDGAKVWSLEKIAAGKSSDNPKEDPQNTRKSSPSERSSPRRENH